MTHQLCAALEGVLGSLYIAHSFKLASSFHALNAIK